MSTTPVALYLQDAHPIREGMDLVQYAEKKGFHAVWQADSRLVRDAIVPMAAFGSVTERLKIGSGVIDVWTRNPARLASTFSTLDDLAPGRVILGIGLLGAAYTGTVGAWGYIGVVPLLTGLAGTCPLYTLIGISTCAVKPKG